ncbi:hypothetical protein IWX90DRAFT_245170 [Phyllosticta citrichinensis]|uniref:Uncharacterized protein n=1 Tax=Phyllosticta citrichinensis TaxID=1130410 RepID=A0ABR1XQN3_9PEZI
MDHSSLLHSPKNSQDQGCCAVRTLSLTEASLESNARSCQTRRRFFPSAYVHASYVTIQANSSYQDPCCGAALRLLRCSFAASLKSMHSQLFLRLSSMALCNRCPATATAKESWEILTVPTVCKEHRIQDPFLAATRVSWLIYPSKLGNTSSSCTDARGKAFVSFGADRGKRVLIGAFDNFQAALHLMGWSHDMSTSIEASACNLTIPKDGLTGSRL